MTRSAADSVFQTPYQPQYDHTQHAPLSMLIVIPAIILLVVAFAIANDAATARGMTVLAGIVVIVALSFQTLRVVDEGDFLAVRYGMLPIFRRRIPYKSIDEVQRDRTSWIDGWGIHWAPFRGWTYNLWGFDCARLRMANGSTIRIGTDDPEGLIEFLHAECRRAT